MRKSLLKLEGEVKREAIGEIGSFNGQGGIRLGKNDNASSLWKVPKDGGEETQVFESVYARAFAVAKEGIYFIPRPDSAGRSSTQLLNFARKRLRSITMIEKPVGDSLSISPDGRWILYSQIDQVGSDLMLVENFR